jgi:hypothetical protein
VGALSPSENRLRALVETGVAITSELSLDALLQRLVESAAELTGARYAALGASSPPESTPRRTRRLASSHAVAGSSGY